MAQTTRSSSSRAKGGRPRTKKSNSRNRSSSTSRSRTRTQSSNGPVEKTTEKVAEIASKAKPPATAVRKTGEKVAHAASKAKTPLVAGGAALAGIAGGVALKSRTEAKRRPTSKFSSVQLPKSLKNVDIDQLIEAGRRVRAIGEQVGDVADTADKTHRKHK
jgi:hypothetical protein